MDNNATTLAKASQMFGLHPLVGFGMFAVDSMLFVGTVATAGVGWLISIPVSVALSIPCILIQKYSFDDEWGTAVGKGLMVGLLTAIPTPLPSVISIGGGAIGSAKLLMAPSPKQLAQIPDNEENKGQIYEQ